ncbi:MAG: dienelactone hydrolase family protein [Myxococcaceae bacterium]
MSVRAAQVLSMLLAGVALGEEPPHVHGADAGSAVPAQERHPVDPRPPTPHGKPVELTLPGGKTSTAYVARPKGAPHGGLLVVHEWWGLNDGVKSDADRYAAQGYLVLAVDLFGGSVATTPEQAQKLMSEMDEKHATEVEVAGIDWLTQELKGKKLATLGWCMGGGQSLNASLASPAKVSATVIYYGLPVTDVNLLRKLQGPVLGIWAKRDGWITPEKVAAFDLALKDAGIKHEFRSYDADHAFANPTGGRYNPPAAQDANEAARRFLKSALK